MILKNFQRYLLTMYRHFCGEATRDTYDGFWFIREGYDG